MWLERQAQQDPSFDVPSALGTTKAKLADFMASKRMRDLCSVEGAAMFAVANCMNHSCAPNVQAASATDDHSVRFVALHEVKEGDELLMSYVDMDAKFEDRQAQLRSRYHFECRCMRCLAKSDD